jgi:hypothetical protein
MCLEFDAGTRFDLAGAEVMFIICTGLAGCEVDPFR